MTTMTPTNPGLAGQRRQLGTYQTPDGQRQIIGQRIDGRVRLTDTPTHGGRAYLIEAHLANLAELDAIVADYLQQADRHGDCPMRISW